jgi:cell division protein FtsW
MSSSQRARAGGEGARYWLLGAAFFLTAVGLVMIYSASSITAMSKEGNSWHYLVRQLVFAATGWGIALAVGRFDFRRLKDTYMLLWGVCVGLLAVVFAMGVAAGGAQRWIDLGFLRIQPSELAKIACVIAIAVIAAEWQRGRLCGKDFAVKAAWITAIPAAFIIMQPDMGTTATLIAAVLIVLVLAGMNLRYLFVALTGAVGLATLFIMQSEYRMLRVLGFLDPWQDRAGKGYQIIQALYAFGSGGLTGVGLGLSRQKFFYLPEAHTDFILAIIGEEIGLLGTLSVVLAFCILVWAGFRIALGARDPFGRLLAGGLTGVLGAQAFVNMAAVTGIMPVTGKPLPFVSYGGASMLVTMLAVGLVLSVSEYGLLAPKAVRAKKPAKEHARESTGDRGRDRGPHLSRSDRGRPVRRRA